MSEAVKQVSRFEANLLQILQYLLRRGPDAKAFEWIRQTLEPPPCLSPTVVDLVKSTLARGTVAILTRSSGWWKERHLQGEAVVTGRLWERYAPAELGLSFSEAPLEFLIWLTAKNPDAEKLRWPKIRRQTIGDQLFFYLAYRQSCGPVSRKSWDGKGYFGKMLFVGSPIRMALRWAPTQKTKSIFRHGLRGLALPFWKHCSRNIRTDGWKWSEIKGILSTGIACKNWRAEERTLDVFLTSLEQSHRPDLVRFLFPVLHELLPENANVQGWTEKLRATGIRLADCAETYRAALAVVRILGRLKRWRVRWRGVGYFDEHYASSQLWKSEWERWHGETLARRARVLLETVDTFR